MELRLDKLSWTYIRSFLAVAEAGSLTQAAVMIGQSQPTIGRHIHGIETALGAELFTRTATGFQLTEAGRMIYEPAKDMAAAAARVEMLAMGRETRLTGTVRITASVVVSHYLLPSILADIRRQEPDIELELAPSDASENLIFREADIAIRMYRPTQLDIITKHICDQPLALYAAPTLLEKLPAAPKSFDDILALPFVGFDRSDLIIRVMRQLGHVVDRRFFGVRCDDQATYWQLVCAGCGIGAMQTVIGDSDPHVTRLMVQPELPALPVWLAAPEALRTNARIKRVWDLLEVGLRGLQETNLRERTPD